jgi:hypothetical protein
MEALPEFIRVRQSFLSSGSIECGSTATIMRIPTESRLSSPSCVSGSWLVGIPMTLPRSGWFINHSKSFISFSYVICAFTYRTVELVFVLLYVWSHVWGSIEYSGTRCGNYYLIPCRLTTLIRQKFLDSAVDLVSEALSMRVAHPVIRIVVVPAGVKVLLGLYNPPWRTSPSGIAEGSRPYIIRQVSKREFWMKQGSFFSHVILEEWLSVDSSKIRDMLSWNAPASDTDIHSPLGLVGFSKITKPMIELLGKDKKFKWTPACEVSF